MPWKQVPYLGLISDSEKQAFIFLPHKKEKFLVLLKRALSSETINLVTLQRLGGKCISMALAMPGVRLYTSEINLALSCAVQSSHPVKLSWPLRQDLEHWLFLETWNGFLPWWSEKHSHFQLFSDSSSFAWGKGVYWVRVQLTLVLATTGIPVLLGLTLLQRKVWLSTMSYSPLGIL